MILKELILKWYHWSSCEVLFIDMLRPVATILFLIQYFSLFLDNGYSFENLIWVQMKQISSKLLV